LNERFARISARTAALRATHPAGSVDRIGRKRIAARFLIA